MTGRADLAEACAEHVIEHIRRTGLDDFYQALANLEARPRRYGKRARKAEAAAVPAKPETGSALIGVSVRPPAVCRAGARCGLRLGCIGRGDLRALVNLSRWRRSRALEAGHLGKIGLRYVA
jgi:hypothetical protein